ncbi:MAG: phenylacetate-CoA oxygenase subunit PaaC [Actinobacteria bacterium]|nr:phenylacetate-CoA oxygenase subunit PaaC [Actinomycetota bacterium]
MTAPEDPRVGLLLSIADDELVMGHRHSEWTGWAPHIEEDLAFSSIAQDEIAHARLLYELAEPLTGRTPDEMALGRGPGEYRSSWLCERPNGDWGYSIARQFLYDTADAVRLEALTASSWTELGDLVKVMQMEERYHLDHGRAWFERLSAGPVTGRQRLADGLSASIGEAVALFEPLPDEEGLVADRILPRPTADLLSEWLGAIGEELEAASLDFVLERHASSSGEMVPTSSGEMEGEEEAFSAPGVARRDGRWVHEGGFSGAGGRFGRHSEDFLPLWEEMTGLFRAHPGARW